MSLSRYHDIVVQRWYGGGRSFTKEAIKVMEEQWEEKNVFIINAPTGYGKTTISGTIALYSLREELKCIIALPLRSLIEDQYSKFRELVRSELLIGKRYMHEPGSTYLVKPITLTTIDTLSMTLFGIPPEDLNKIAKKWSGTSTGSFGHYLFSWTSTALSSIILDEVHLLADFTKSLNFLASLIYHANMYGQKLVLMSATLPKALETVLREQLKKFSNKMLFIKFSRQEDRAESSYKDTYNFYDERFIKERLQKNYRINIIKISSERLVDKILPLMRDGFDRGHRKVIVVFNTVNEAINFYIKCLETNLLKADTNLLLLHSRYAAKDRAEKIEQLNKLKREKEYVIVSTQVIEAGVDISSDLMITDLAPASSLIQRCGRFLRREEPEGELIIWSDPEKIKNGEEYYKGVYDRELTNKTLNLLETLSKPINLHIPISDDDRYGYDYLLDNVYSRDSFKISEGQVDKMLSIKLNLEKGSQRAIELFYDLEGSFIRESIQVPVSVKEPESVDSSELLTELLGSESIPIPLKLIVNPSMIRMIIRARYEEGRRKIILEKPDKSFTDLISRRDKRLLIRRILSGDILALIIYGEYDKRLGLRMSGYDDI